MYPAMYQVLLLGIKEKTEILIQIIQKKGFVYFSSTSSIQKNHCLVSNK